MQNLDDQIQNQGSTGNQQPLDFHPSGQQVGENATAQPGTGTQGSQSGGGGDFLDKGVNYAEQRSGHPQSASTTEKASDGLRSGFKKMTGRDVPIQDKESQ